MSKNEKTKWSKTCPVCGEEQTYKSASYLNRAVINNSCCRHCVNQGRTHSDETKKKMSISHMGENNHFYGKTHTREARYKIRESKLHLTDETKWKLGSGMRGKTHSDETKKKISELNTGKTISDEHKTKISNANTGKVHSDDTKKKISKNRKGKASGVDNPMFGKFGKDNPNFGKTRSNEFCDRLREINTGKTHSDDTKLKLSIARRNRVITDETKCKQRLSMIKYVESVKLNGGQMKPNYNISSIPIIESKARELGITDLQHAENGGEFYIEELGYWVDGYSKEKNTVIEYYEKRHNSQEEKDLRRQKEITNLLKCEFIIITE